MKKTIGFRAWFYFRTGWASYFAFIMAAANTLVVTYYLAIENLPFLKDIFPTFTHYIIIGLLVGVPILIITGYIHFKRSKAFGAEADINIEANIHIRRLLLNTEAIIESQLKVNELVLKLSKNEKLSEDELAEITYFQKKLNEHMKHRTIPVPDYKTDSKKD